MKIERVNLDEEPEISSILDRMVEDLTRGGYRESEEFAKCCNTPTRGGVSVKSFEEFEYFAKNCVITFVLVTTTYCPYCQLFKPVFFNVAKEYQGKAMFIEANADYVPEVAEMFNVYSTPTTIVLIDGRPVDAILGYVPYSYFKRFVEGFVNSIKCR